jgi:hypothetical protein
LEEHAQRARSAAPTASSHSPVPDIGVFDLLYFTLKKYLYLRSPHELVAISLWALHTFVFDRFMITPRLALLSPVRGCGKTTVLGLLSRLTYRAERSDHATPAALYRTIEEFHPTMLIDEADNMELSVPGPLRAVFNSGHSQDGSIIRMGRRFSTFAPMAIADRNAASTTAAALDHRPYGAGPAQRRIEETGLEEC